ncbi:MAG: LegC family aminotransferase [Bacteroidetes bacterium]|nr:MAG: LegC family aminotransferase [Bacteroidota bacterium]
MIKSTIQFIREIYGVKEGQIPLHVPFFNGNEQKYVNDAVVSGETSASGAYIQKFEKALAEYTGAKEAVAVSNGTAALHVALHMVGVTTGEEVITQALTFVATGNAIRYVGAQPVFVDVDADSMGMSPESLEGFLKSSCEKRSNGVFNVKSGKRIAAVLPMHTLGFPVRIEEIAAVCKEWDLPLIEDAAEALGAKVGDKHVGLFGAIGTLSFNGNKSITSGGGGALILNDSKLANRARHLISTAKKPHTYEYFHDELGFNYVMPNLNAALALGQIEHLSEMLYQKRALGYVYSEHMEREGVKMRSERPGTKANFWLITLQLADRKQRTEFLDALNAADITCRPIWTLLHKMPEFKSCQTTDLTHSQFLEDRIVNVPSSVKGLRI